MTDQEKVAYAVSALEHIASIGKSQAALDLSMKVGDANAVAYQHQHVARAALATLKGARS